MAKGRGVSHKKRGRVAPLLCVPGNQGLLAFRGEPFRVGQHRQHPLGMFPDGFNGGLRRMQSPLG